MNAAAHLQSLGWTGPGTGLHKGSRSHPILSSQKKDQKGLGAPKESDQWWDSVFSASLSAIQVNGSQIKVDGGVQHPVAARHAHRKVMGSALDRVFVKGDTLKSEHTKKAVKIGTTKKDTKDVKVMKDVKDVKRSLKRLSDKKIRKAAKKVKAKLRKL